MKIILDILSRKKDSIDCSEQESAEIKGFLREFIPIPGKGEVEIVDEIQELFPIEYGEVLDEWEKLDSSEKHEKIKNSFQ